MAAGQGTNGPWGYLPAALAAALCAWFATMLPGIEGGAALRWGVPWVPDLGIALAFAVDGLSLTFALLISGIGALVLLYSNAYLAGHEHWWRFAGFLFAFMLSMLGLVLADDLIALFVFWELTTITSYLLIGFNHADPKARRSALQALFVTGAGALALLAGLILLGLVAGTTSIEAINAMGPQIVAHPLYPAILILVLAGAFTKSAQFPLHFWLPNAMAAPTPVSAFLHSATMVKGGVFLMARLHPALSGSDAWFWALTLFGGVTAVFASVLALRQTDLKQVLAYTTLMALGTLTLLLAQPGAYAVTAFAAFLIVHSLYKAALFLAVGCIDHGTGTREAGILGGLARPMPVTALAAGLAALSMAGLPPFIGYIGKELIYAGAGESPATLLVAGFALAANAMMVAAAGIVAFRPFWRPAGGPLPHAPHEAPWPMLAGPVILALAGLALGLAPEAIQGRLIGPAVATFGEAEAKTLKLWAGFNLALYLSLATFAIGFLLYALHPRIRAALARAEARAPSFDAGWDGFLGGLRALAAWQTRLVQSGRLGAYLRTVFGTLLIGVVGTILARGIGPLDLSLAGGDDLQLKHLAVVALLVAGTVAAAATASRIAAIAALGVVGIAVALIFILYGAPDVAITQLLVETLIVVLVAVIMLRLPRLSLPGVREFRPWDLALACAIGASVSLILLAVLAQPLDLRLTEYFEVTSWPEAFGRNVVNVILVDFRAIDTFGEIAVVAMAALGGYALLRTRPAGAEGGARIAQSSAEHASGTALRNGGDGKGQGRR